MRKALLYFVSTALSSGIPFLLAILLARYVTVVDAGLMALYTTQFALGSILVGFGAYASVQARFFIDRARFASYLSASVFFHLLSLAVLAVLLFAFKDRVAAWASLPAWALFTALGLSFLQCLLTMHLLLIQAKGWAGRYLLLQLTQILLLAVLAPLLAIGLSLGWRGFVFAQLAQLLLITPWNLRVLSATFGLGARFRAPELWANARYGLGLVPHSLAGFVIVGYDRIYVGAHAGTASAGIYSVMLQIGMLASMVMTAVNKVYTPWMYARLKERREWGRIGHATWIGIAGIVALCGVLAPLSYAGIGPLLGTKYLEGRALIAWVVLAGAFNGVYLLVANLIFYSERMLLLSFATVFGALAKWWALPPLFAAYGLQGAAMSNVIGLAVCMFMTMGFAVYLYDRRVLFGSAMTGLR